MKMFKKTALNTKNNLFNLTKKHFRNWRMEDYMFTDNRHYQGTKVSPYMPRFSLSEEEKLENNKLPVEERTLDYQKYMSHKGKLKYATGTYLLDVEPFPRLKIMLLCHIINNHLREFVDEFLYKHILAEYIKFVMQVVDENEALVDIETAITNKDSCEDLISDLNREVMNLRALLKNDYYLETLKEHPEDEIEIFSSAIFTNFDGENVSHRKNEKPERDEKGWEDVNENI